MKDITSPALSHRVALAFNPVKGAKMPSMTLEEGWEIQDAVTKAVNFEDLPPHIQVRILRMELANAEADMATSEQNG